MLFLFNFNVRKRCKAKFYQSNVKHVHSVNPKNWWEEVKWLSGSFAGSGGLNNKWILILKELEICRRVNWLIYKGFLEPLEEYQLLRQLTYIPLKEHSPEFLQVSEEQSFQLLSKLHPAKEIPRIVWPWRNIKLAVARVYRISCSSGQNDLKHFIWIAMFI